VPYYKYNTTRETDDGVVPGVFLPAVIHNLHHYLTLLAVYKDGMIDCWGLVTFEEFVAKTQWGWVTNTVSPGRTLGLHHLVDVTVTTSEPAGTIDDLVKDVLNPIEELNGRPTAQERIAEAIKAFAENDTPTVRAAFLSAYSDLPCFHRKYIFGSRMEKHKDIQRLLKPKEDG
jgi:hypothetical protein